MTVPWRKRRGRSSQKIESLPGSEDVRRRTLLGYNALQTIKISYPTRCSLFKDRRRPATRNPNLDMPKIEVEIAD